MALTPLKEDVPAARRDRGEYEFTIGTDRYRLRHGTNALALMETVPNAEGERERAVTIQQRFAMGEEKLLDYRLVLWSMLQSYHPGSTLEEVGDFMDDVARAAEGKPGAVQELVQAGFEASTPEKEPSDPDPPPTVRVGRRKKKGTSRRAGGTGGGSKRTRGGSG